MEFGRGGAYVPARVAPQGRIHRSSPAHNACILGMETPLRGRSGGHTGTAPTVSFGWIVCGRLMSFGQIMSGRLMLFGCITRGWLVPFGEDCARMYNGDGRDESPRRESWRVCLLHQAHGFGLFHEQGHEWFTLVGHLIVEHGILQSLF